MPKHKLPALLSLGALLAAFLTVSKYIDGILAHNYPNVASLIANGESPSRGCVPGNGSILAGLSRGKNSLLIILDGYPDPEMFRHIAGEESRLHEALLSQSASSATTHTVIDNTAYSLAYLLAGASRPKESCRYPLLSSRPPLNLLLASQYFSSRSSLCRSRLPFGWDYLRNELSRNGFAQVSSLRPLRYIFTMPAKCSLLSPAAVNDIANSIRTSAATKGASVHVLHEVQWHDYSYVNRRVSLRNQSLVDGLKLFDRHYADSLTSLIATVRRGRLVDNIIVLSDHGPRFESFAKPVKYPVAIVDAGDSLPLKNFYGVFLYYLPVASRDKASEAVLGAALDRLESRKPAYLFEINRTGMPRRVSSL